MTSKYPHIFVVGNGFDIDLNLKTSYTDFIYSEVFKKLITDNENHLCSYLKDKHDLVNWSDIEKELAVYSRKAKKYKIGNIDKTEAFPNAETFEREYKELSAALVEYLSSLDYNAIDKKSTAYQLLKNQRNNSYLFIDFNYTPSLKNILSHSCMDTSLSESTIIKPHNSLKAKDIIFGVEDNADILPNYIFLKKSFSNYYNCSNFSEYLENADSVIFFGYSLGCTDHDYFRDFFTGCCGKLESKEIKIYYSKNCDSIKKEMDTLTGTQFGKFRRRNNIEFIDTSQNKKDRE